MHAISPRILHAVLVAVYVCGCASGEQRYQENKTNLQLSPRSKSSLSANDVDQICRLLAHATRMRMICISTASVRTHANAFKVVVGYSWSDTPSDFQSQFGLYYVKRDEGTWRILEGGPGLSGSLIGIACEDPPK